MSHMSCFVDVMRDVYIQSKYFRLFSVELNYDFSTIYFVEKLHEFLKFY